MCERILIRTRSPVTRLRWQLDVEQLGRVNGWKLSSAARRGISGVRVPRAPSLADAVLLPRTQHCCAFATPSRYTDLSWWNPHHARRTACRTRWCALPTNHLHRHRWVSALNDCLFVVLVQSSRPPPPLSFNADQGRRYTRTRRWNNFFVSGEKTFLSFIRGDDDDRGEEWFLRVPLTLRSVLDEFGFFFFFFFVKNISRAKLYRVWEGWFYEGIILVDRKIDLLRKFVNWMSLEYNIPRYFDKGGWFDSRRSAFSMFGCSIKLFELFRPPFFLLIYIYVFHDEFVHYTSA